MKLTQAIEIAQKNLCGDCAVECVANCSMISSMVKSIIKVENIVCVKCGEKMGYSKLLPATKVKQSLCDKCWGEVFHPEQEV